MTTFEQIAARLKLARPLVFIDCETTQPHELSRPKPDKDNIVQFAATKIHPDGSTRSFKTLIKPLLRITAQSTGHHGITEDMVAEAPFWREAGPGIITGLRGCDLAGFFVKRYDLPLLRAECERHHIHGPEPDDAFRIVDVHAIATEKERRDLTWAVKYYANRELTDAHQADADVLGSIDAFAGQLAMYPDLPADVKAMHEWTFPVDPTWVDADGKLQWYGDEVVITFGDQAGTPVRVLEQGLVDWILRKNFSDTVKTQIRNIRAGRMPTKPVE